jgi:hypothetical protein
MRPYGKSSNPLQTSLDPSSMMPQKRPSVIISRRRLGRELTLPQKDKPKGKNLLLELTTKEYSDFWYIGELLGKSKKKDIFIGMMDFVKKFKEKNE